jgi:hypothetical protein
MTTLLAIAAIAAPLAQADAAAATHLDPTNLPCTPSCPNPPAADAGSVPAQRLILEDDGFDWGDAGVGAGIGIAAMLAGLAGALETRRHRALAR